MKEIVHRSGKLVYQLYWQKETEELFHYKYIEDWDGEEEGRGERGEGEKEGI